MSEDDTVTDCRATDEGDACGECDACIDRLERRCAGLWNTATAESDTTMSEDDTTITRDDLADAEAVLDRYHGAELITDEAYLLRGCLYALVAIGRQLQGK